jgi:LppX_LprAFG lipoprotein
MAAAVLRPKNMRMVARLAAPLLGTLLLACSGPGGASSTPDAAKILKDAGQAVARVKSVTADVKFGGARIQVQGLTLTAATSKVRLPGDSDTIFKVKQGDFLVDLRVVTSGGKVFVKLPFSPFVELTGQQVQEIPDVSTLFNEQSGLPALLREGRNPNYQATEQVGGTDCDRVGATYTAGQVGRLLGGRLAPQGDVHATVWVGRSDHLPRKTVLSGKLTSSGVSQVEVDLHDFNKPMAITAPTT